MPYGKKDPAVQAAIAEGKAKAAAERAARAATRCATSHAQNVKVKKATHYSGR